jgi:protein-tyrosine phosphatase
MAPMDSAVPQIVYKVLFVCMGNICRSPALMAELHRQAKAREVTDRLYVDSCAVTGWHVGEPADYRMCAAALAHGLEIHHVAKIFEKTYFTTFDWVLAVDREVLHLLEQEAKHAVVTSQIALATSFSKAYKDQDIADPYYGGEKSFDLTMIIIRECCQGILDTLFRDSQ